MDEKYVNVLPSKIGGREEYGAFAKIDVPANTSFALYGGLIFDRGQQHENLVNTQQDIMKQFIRNEKNGSKIIQYFDSLNKFR